MTDEFLCAETRKMEKRVSKAAFKAKACELFRRVEMLGECVVVTDRGHPTVEIRPYRKRRRDPLEVLRGSILYFDAESAPPLIAQAEEV